MGGVVVVGAAVVAGAAVVVWAAVVAAGVVVVGAAVVEDAAALVVGANVVAGAVVEASPPPPHDALTTRPRERITASPACRIGTCLQRGGVLSSGGPVGPRVRARVVGQRRPADWFSRGRRGR